ncbi:hypothetical protein SAMN04487843_12351 [Methylobacterium sp. ap11]|uniref:hypothetical protein n=1 Tax=Methylobacterium sp. ap11 TaxID=1761799 RepID=UPI0008BF01DB|nr:hypothetical protein [Methylobacterium sp. ap11]SEP46318.1 hypothetical protein SAMN04487843_12351 [Methylobacterium sp. ap11]
MTESGEIYRTSLLARMTTLLAVSGLLAMQGGPARADPDVVLPSVARVMRAVCGHAVEEEARTCRMKDGRIAEYWYGAMFAADQGWAVGFATLPAPDQDPQAPDARTVIAATFAQTQTEGRIGWVFKNVQTLPGRIGTGNRNGDAPQVDDSLGPVFRPLPGGRLVMGLRTTAFGNQGSQSFAFLVLRFTPAPLQWRQSGGLPAGSDDTAGCGAPEDGPCNLGASTGRLEILAGAADRDSGAPPAWPPLRVTLTGTVPGPDGRVRPATARDARTYRFDEAAGVYR